MYEHRYFLVTDSGDFDGPYRSRKEADKALDEARDEWKHYKLHFHVEMRDMDINTIEGTSILMFREDDLSYKDRSVIRVNGKSVL